MLNNIWQRSLLFIQEWIGKMLKPNDVKTALNIELPISSDMVTALQQWGNMYKNQADWLISDEIFSLNLPATIAAELAGNSTLEMAFTLSGSPRADYLASQVDPVIDDIQFQLEYGLAKGSMVFKPYVAGKKILVDFVQADAFTPVQFDSNGVMTGAVFNDQKHIGAHYYTRLEYHSLDGEKYTVRNVAFKSTSKDDLGSQVDLAAVTDWAGLQPFAMYSPIKQPLFGFFKVPMANSIDPGSPLGVSIYSRAVDLIKRADIAWSDLLWEMESGRRALYVDELAFGRDSNSKPILPNKRLYRTLKATGAVDDESFFEEWTPTMREESMLKALDAILARVEVASGLAFGTLVTNPANVAKTATEIRIQRQRSFRTITNTQKALKRAIDDLVYAMDIWTGIKKLAPKGTYKTGYFFDDSVIADKDAQFSQDSMSLSQGTLGRIEFRMRQYNESRQDAEKAIAAIDEEKAKAAPVSTFFPDE